MKRIDTSIVLGLLLTGLGVVFLLQTVLGLAFVWNIVWALLFGAAGVGFLLAFFGNRERWWALIPGFALLGIAGLIAFGDFLGEWGGTLFLGALESCLLGCVSHAARVLVGRCARRCASHLGGDPGHLRCA